MARSWLPHLAIVAAAGCKPPAPPTVNEPPRLDAVEACAEPGQDPIPAPMGRGLVVGFTDAAGWHPATALCDLPDRVVVLAAEQSVHGKRGTAWTIARGGRAAEARILPSSPGCSTDKVACTWETDAPGMPSIEVLRAPPRLPTSGWVHGREDMCRALPDDAFAVCSTATRMAFVTQRCGGPGVSIALHDTSLPRAFDLDVEVPVARVHATATQEASGRWTYAGEGTSLTIDIDAHTGALTVGGQREDCIAIGLYSG